MWKISPFNNIEVLPNESNRSGSIESLVEQLSKVKVEILRSMFQSKKQLINSWPITAALCGAGTYINLQNII